MPKEIRRGVTRGLPSLHRMGFKSCFALNIQNDPLQYEKKLVWELDRLKEACTQLSVGEIEP